MKLSDINIYDLGSSIGMTGVLWQGKGKSFITMFPTFSVENEIEEMEMSLEDWTKLIYQIDNVETEVLRDDGSGLKKIILRKAQSTIDARVSWSVYKRDYYRCRYCGLDGVPLTVDHIITWESNGATIPENLLTACKKCNKERGNTSYEEWITSEKYKSISKFLDPLTKQKNIDIVKKLEKLSSLKVKNVRSR